MVTANSVKFSSVTYKIFPSNTGQAKSLDVRRSKLAFWASISTRLREYDNILCPSLCSNDLSSQAPHKSSLLRENFKITFKSVLGHIRFVLMLVPHSAKSRDVTSLLKWVYCRKEISKRTSISFSVAGMRRWVLNGISGQIVFLKMALHCFLRRLPLLLCGAFQ